MQHAVYTAEYYLDVRFTPTRARLGRWTAGRGCRVQAEGRGSILKLESWTQYDWAIGLSVKPPRLEIIADWAYLTTKTIEVERP